MNTNLRIVSRFILALTLFTWTPLVTAAGVRSMEATLENGQVHVRWEAPANQEVAEYRVYFSRTSILQNQGLYDDFGKTSADKTDYIIAEYPDGPELFVTVVPVDANGTEEPFTTEVGVPLIAEGTDPGTEEPSAVPPESLQLLSAEATSSTGVTLHFNAPASVSSLEAPTAFSITDGSGAVLPLVRLAFLGNEVRLDTAEQIIGTRYTVRIAPVVLGTGPAGERLVLDVMHAETAFFAFGTTLPEAPAPEPVDTGSGALAQAEVTNLAIQSTREKNGRYTISATWNPPTNVSALQVLQTLDEGKTFSEPQEIPATAGSIRFQGVLPGSFGLLIRTVDAAGTPSKGVFGTISLEGSMDPRNGLAQSGIGLTAVLAASGGIAGWRRMKRKNADESLGEDDERMGLPL